MDQRKLIKLGNSSFAIALPKGWVDKSGLKKGDNIFITPNSNGELIIQSQYKGNNHDKKIILNFEGKSDKEMEREISSSYVKDYNIFEVRGIEKEKRDFVEHLLKSLISLEIIEKNKEAIISKDFFNLSEMNLENFLRRIDNSMRNMFEETKIYFKKGKISAKELKEVYEIDWDINRLYFLIYRIFVKGVNNPSLLSTLNVNSITLLNSWQIAVKIEEIGDEIKRICTLINRANELKEKEKIFELFLKVRDVYIELLSGYYNKEIEKVKKTTFYKKELIKKFDELSNNKDATVVKTTEKFKHISSSIHELSKLLLYTIDENDKKE